PSKSKVDAILALSSYCYLFFYCSFGLPVKAAYITKNEKRNKNRSGGDTFFTECEAGDAGGPGSVLDHDVGYARLDLQPVHSVVQPKRAVHLGVGVVRKQVGLDQIVECGILNLE